MASYHFEGKVLIAGILWNFMLPTGWFAIVAGVVLLFHNRIGLKKQTISLCHVGG